MATVTETCMHETQTTTTTTTTTSQQHFLSS